MGVTVDGVCFSYGKMEVLSHVNFKVENGELTCLLGPNGAGKSTLLKILAGILRPQRGTVRFEKRIGEKEISYVPQSPSFVPHLTVFEAVLTGRMQHFSFFPREKDFKKVEKTLELLKISDLAWKRLGELSGGQRQKVFLAMALVKEPLVVLLDEPTNNLDLRSQLEIMNLTKRLVTEKSISAIVATHDLNLSLKFADKVVLMNRGQIAAFGKPKDVLKKDLLESVYGVEVEILNYCEDLLVVPLKAI